MKELIFQSRELTSHFKEELLASIQTSILDYQKKCDQAYDEVLRKIEYETEENILRSKSNADVFLQLLSSIHSSLRKNDEALTDDIKLQERSNSKQMIVRL